MVVSVVVIVNAGGKVLCSQLQYIQYLQYLKVNSTETPEQMTEKRRREWSIFDAVLMMHLFKLLRSSHSWEGGDQASEVGFLTL